MAKPSKDCADADKDDGETNDERDRTEDRATTTGAPLDRSSGASEKRQIAGQQRQYTG